MCCARCWLITPSIGWIGDSLYPTPSIRLIPGWRRALDLPIISLHVGKSFFLLFLLTTFFYALYYDATRNAFLVWRVWYAPNKIARHRMEIDYGNKESYDKRDGKRD